MGKLIKRMTRELMSAIDHIVAVEGENDALRVERVQLQAENEALAHDLKLVQTQLDAGLHAENDALRAERAQLQTENKALRNDLAHQPSGIVLDGRDRELLRHAAWLVRNANRTPFTPTGGAAYRLLRRLAEQPVEDGEHVEEEGGPAPTEPDQAGYGTWVAEPSPHQIVEIGDKVRMKAGAISLGGFLFDSRVEWYVTALRTPKAHAYTVKIGRQPYIALGFWVRPGDLTRVEEPRE